MPRPTTSSGKKGKARKTSTTTHVEVIEVAPDISTLAELGPSQEEEEDVDDTETEEGPTFISRASNSEPTPSTSSFTQPRELPRRPPRVSHTAIPNYDFTDEQLQTLRDFIQANEELYVKTHKSYSNPTVKNDLWHKCAKLFPDCDWLQCRKLFEQRRTAFGKREKKEIAKSGAAAKRDRTEKEERLMQEWAFLRGHISHSGITTSSHVFPDVSPIDTSSENDSAASGLSAHSLDRRRKKKMRRPSESPASSSHSTTATQGMSTSQQDAHLTSAIRRLVGESAAIITQRSREPWADTPVEHWSKMMANIVHELPASFKDKAMSGAWAYIIDIKSQATIAEAGRQTPQHHGQTLPVQHVTTAPTTTAPTTTAPTTTVPTTTQATNLAPAPGHLPAPNLHYVNPAATLLQSSGYPATPVPPTYYYHQTGTTPTTNYQPQGPLQHQFHHPPITTYQHYGPPASTSAVVPTTSSSLNLHVSPSMFPETNILTELRVFPTTSSTVNTPSSDRNEEAEQ